MVHVNGTDWPVLATWKARLDAGRRLPACVNVRQDFLAYHLHSSDTVCIGGSEVWVLQDRRLLADNQVWNRT